MYAAFLDRRDVLNQCDRASNSRDGPNPHGRRVKVNVFGMFVAFIGFAIPMIFYSCL